MSGDLMAEVSCVNRRFFERQGDEPDLDKGACRWFPPAVGYDARPLAGRATVLGR